MSHRPSPAAARPRAIATALLLGLGVVACGDDDGASSTDTSTTTTTTASGSGGDPTSSVTSGAGGDGSTGSGDGGASSTSGAGGSGGDGAGGDGGTPDPGPAVDTSDPQLYTTVFRPDQADPEAATVIGDQRAVLDTRVTPRGLLVVYLHGAGDPSGGTCGSAAHSELLAGMGFHVVDPCYESNYGVGNCGDDIEGCRLEAFEGIDHHPFIDVAPADGIEVRVARALGFAQAANPEGDWTYFLDGELPRWSKIVVSGISHGASTSGVIGLHREVRRVVMLSGPLDSGQAWLEKAPLTPIDAYFGFTAVSDEQHAGHLAAFEALGLPGAPTSVDGVAPPYGGSHRLLSSAPGNSHGATQAGGGSPEVDGDWLYRPVWEHMYTSGL